MIFPVASLIRFVPLLNRLNSSKFKFIISPRYYSSGLKAVGYTQIIFHTLLFLSGLLFYMFEQPSLYCFVLFITSLYAFNKYYIYRKHYKEIDAGTQVFEKYLDHKSQIRNSRSIRILTELLDIDKSTVSLEWLNYIKKIVRELNELDPENESVNNNTIKYFDEFMQGNVMILEGEVAFLYSKYRRKHEKIFESYIKVYSTGRYEEEE